MRHILLAEDNPGDVLLFREAIRSSPKLDADVVVAYDGEQAIRLLKTAQPDVVVLDLNLPKVTGMEILERSKGLLKVPVLILTSSDNPMDVERAKKLGVSEYVRKPIDLSVYIDTVRRALERCFVE
jgi:CheY-like chemotaxis protein